MNSILEKFPKDVSGKVLFILSLSVILITLGIIQTLLFESITFFEQIAENRGWFPSNGISVELSLVLVWLH